MQGQSRSALPSIGPRHVCYFGRFPVTLYKEQWLRLLEKADDIRAFIAANEAQLKSKNEK